MAHKSKLRCRKIVRKHKVNSLTPSYQTAMNFVPRNTNRLGGRRRHRRNRQKLCRVNIKQKQFVEMPMRKDVQIRRSIDRSIKSHINRLADYRYQTMMRTSDPCCPYGPCRYDPRSLPNVVPSYTYPPRATHSFSHRIPGMAKHSMRTFRSQRKLKKEKEQELRTIDFDNEVQDAAVLEGDIKKITEMVNSFEKQRIEFLSSLAKIHAQISGLRIQPGALKQHTENEIKKQSEAPKPKQEAPPTSLVASPSINHAFIRNLNIDQYQKQKLKKRPVLPNTRNPKLSNLKSNIMDDLSKLLISAGQKPGKAESVTSFPFDKFPAMQSGLPQVKGLPLQGGLMGLAQTFCSMATGI